MGAALPLILSVLLAAPAPAARSAQRRPAHGARFEAASARLNALKRDRVKRRYHQNWEKAIKALQAAAVGKDAPVATLGAARARYALYRWSARESDRDAALRLARKAERLGARDAAKLSAAIRREAGEDRPHGVRRKEKGAVAMARARGSSARAPAPAARVAPRPPAHGARFEGARTQLKALMRDPVRRRYHHLWDRAIRALLKTAVGKDAPVATLEAARARYALYRWSANEADRNAALLLARRAQRLGARDAARFAAAIRREAGDDHPAAPRQRKPAVATAPSRGGPARLPAPPAPPPAGPELDPVPEPELEAAVADLKAPPALELGSSNGAGTASIGEVRAWAGEDYTRVAISLDHWVGWQRFELPAAGGAPRRLALDFRPARLEGSAQARRVEGDQVDRVRSAQHDAETVRVVLDLPGSDDVRFYRLDDPPRLIVDVGIRLAEREARDSARDQATPTPPPAGGATASAPATSGEGEGSRRPVRRIVVDAGHGGLDPGAIGPTGVREKDVTLAISKRLERRLRKAGFEVLMTRTNDRYVALEERTAIANGKRGDLFVSIHANANPRRSLAGVESWVLNVADDRYSTRLAARENGVDPDEAVASSDARRILTDLDARSATDASRSLAEQVQREITSSVRERVGAVQDLGVKSALFYVLVGARMPAVLVETAFISNRREERRLASARYQEEVAGAVARAVVTFAAQQDPRLAHAP